MIRSILERAKPLCVAAIVLASSAAQAAGVIPETSVVLIDAANGEGTITVKNTDSMPTLLHTSIEDLPEDKERLLVVTPAVARVEAYGSQTVRFLLSPDASLKTERMKRVVFEGLPQEAAGNHRIYLTVRQNLPVLIRPKGLAHDREPWKRLTWSVRGNTLVASNGSPYVVRLTQKVQVMPGEINLQLPKSYILPGESVETTASDARALALATTVRVFPVTRYGYAAHSYEASIGSAGSVEGRAGLPASDAGTT